MAVRESGAQLQHYSYGGKHFAVPCFEPGCGSSFVPDGETATLSSDLSLCLASDNEAVSPVEDGDDEGNQQTIKESSKDLHDKRRRHCITTFCSFHSVWDHRHFEEVHAPLIVGRVPTEHQHLFSFASPSSFSSTSSCLVAPLPRTLDMPIKFPGSNEYRVPAALERLLPIIRQIADMEHTFISPSNLDYYCYLTVDQGIVQPGHTQRHPGYHVDGFQGSRVDPKVMVNHTYVVSDCLPTVFCLQRWEVEQLDPTKHNFFLEFDRQAQEGNAWQADPFDIVLLNAYTVHKAATLPSSSPPLARTFLRLSYSVRVFDRLGNAHNPLFDYNWEMVPRDTQSTLSLRQQQEENAEEGEEKGEEREIKIMP